MVAVFEIVYCDHIAAILSFNNLDLRRKTGFLINYVCRNAIQDT